MGVYARYVLPRLVDLVMRAAPQSDQRRTLVPRARGRVVEIGFGSGLNLPFYGPDVTGVAAVDPSCELWALARRRVAGAPFRVEFTPTSAERLPFADERFDTAVMTWTLCSIPDPAAALAEVRRTLVPGGRLLFIEHGRAPDASVRAWQARLTRGWRRVAGGCHLDRPVEHLVTAAGFRMAELERGYATGPRPFSYLYRGVAER